jgi:hypothetical protein
MKAQMTKWRSESTCAYDAAGSAHVLPTSAATTAVEQ